MMMESASGLLGLETILVVPCYNEERRLNREAFEAFALSVGFRLKILFVNDGSLDGTLSILRAIEESNPDRFEVLSLEKNGGKAEAVRRGVLSSMDRESPPKYVGYWDADLATPLEALPEFRDLLEAKPELFAAIGSRVKLLGRLIERRLLRHYLGRIFATAASLMLRLPVYDTQCGAKLFRVNPTIRSLFQDRFRTGWIFDVEILARLILETEARGLPPASKLVCEHPLREWRDVAGSKVKPRDFLKAILEFVTIYRHYFVGRRRT